MKLSILMATLTSRKKQFDNIHAFIYNQIVNNNLQDEVEIVVFEDDKQFPVGMKRNALIESAKGEYTCFVDDDDWLSEDYVITIYNALKDNPDVDCIGMKGMLVSQQLGQKIFIHSVRYTSYDEDAQAYYRPPNHLNPIRRDITVNFKFPIMTRGEDFNWAMEMCRANVLKSEVFINKVLYFYVFDFNTTETQFDFRQYRGI